MNPIVISMFLALLLPIYAVATQENIWQKMLAFASISSKTSLLILVLSVWRDDWMLGVVGVIILAVGNASLMLLSHILKRLSEKELC